MQPPPLPLSFRPRCRNRRSLNSTHFCASVTDVRFRQMYAEVARTQQTPRVLHALASPWRLLQDMQEAQRRGGTRGGDGWSREGACECKSERSSLQVVRANRGLGASRTQEYQTLEPSWGLSAHSVSSCAAPPLSPTLLPYCTVMVPRDVHGAPGITLRGKVTEKAKG